MKIAYLTEVNLEERSGVLNKMNEQINAWVEYGHEVYVLSLPVRLLDATNLLITPKVSAVYIFKHQRALSMKFLGLGVVNFLNKMLSVHDVSRRLGEIRPQIVYLREMISFPRAKKMFRNYPVVVEANTLLPEELKHSSFKLRVMYNIFQQKLYKRINGFIGVTDEISDEFKKYNKPVTTIANSIAVDANVPPIENRLTDEAQITFVGSPGCPWHGVDKFVKMAELLPEYTFHLVGPKVDKSLSNLIQHGYQNKEGLHSIYSITDISVGSLALHRNGMNEACPLKVREYLSMGIPVILAYRDKDISSQDFVLELKNEENCIEEAVNSIKQFVGQWKGKRVELSRIAPLISTKVKETQRLSFLEHVIK